MATLDAGKIAVFRERHAMAAALDVLLFSSMPFLIRRRRRFYLFVLASVFHFG